MAYKDWLTINWRMYEVSNDDDFIEEDNVEAVPYSCCNRGSAMACGHYDLRTYGTCTIYRCGCSRPLRRFTKHFLWILFTLYLVNIALEVLLLVIYYSGNQDVDMNPRRRRRRSKNRGDVITEYSMLEGSPWEGMSNCSKGSVSSKGSIRSDSLKESGDSDSNICDCSLEDGTPELTSSHKQVRIFSPLGNSTKSIKVLPD